MREWLFASATQMADALRRQEISATELITLHLDHIEAVNPSINAVVTLAAERALKEARAIEKVIASRQITRPLMGVPITVKDSFDTEGIVSTYGMTCRFRSVPAKDATAVARLRNAGAIILGKTNTSELTLIDPAQTSNTLHGRTNNPYDATRSPSGSSGGPAAAVAAGCSALDLGSDTGGSIRDPAHVCGIVGVKPSAGLVPRTGHCVPYGLGALDVLTQIGPMARCVDDVALALSVISGPDGYDPAMLPIQLNDFATIDLSCKKIAYYTDGGAYTSSDDVVRAVNDAADALKDVGAEVKECLPSPLSRASNLFERLTTADEGNWKRLIAILAQPQKDSESSDACIRQALMSTAASQQALLEELNIFRTDLLRFFSNFDALIGPVAPCAARSHNNKPQAFAFWNDLNAHNISGFPAVSVPTARSPDGLPIGVQVVSAPGCDDVALAVAKVIESRLDGFTKPKF